MANLSENLSPAPVGRDPVRILKVGFNLIEIASSNCSSSNCYLRLGECSNAI